MKPATSCFVGHRFLEMVALMTFVNIGFVAMSIKTYGEAVSRPVRIVAFGDSLTAGYGLPQPASFPVQLAAALKARRHNVEIVNAGVSGDTTAAGLERLDWAIGENTDAVILELGANDALRGMPPTEAKSNLDKIITHMKAHGIEVLLAGMAAPRSLGPDYVAEFDRIFPDLAASHALLLYPFFLDGVAAKPELNLDDGLHPTAKGVAMIVSRILPKVEELLARVATRRARSKS